MIAEDVEHNLYVVDEATTKGGSIEQISTNIFAMLERNNLTIDDLEYRVADPSICATERRAEASGMTIQEEFEVQGIAFSLANNTVRPGINRVTMMILNTIHNKQKEVDSKKPGLYVLSKCVGIIDEFSKYVWKENSLSEEDSGAPQEVKKAFDHHLDALRYVCMSRPDWFDRPAKDYYGRVIRKADDDLFGDDDGENLI